MWQSIKNFSPIPQIYIASTTITDWKEFLENFPIFQNNLHYVQNWYKNGLARILNCYPPPPQLCQSQLKFQSYSTQLHSKDYPSDNKEFLENFPVSQENLHCVPNQYKIDPQFHIQFHIQCFNLLLDYLLLLEISHLFHKSTHRASNLAKNIFEEISPFSRKTYIVCKISTKMVLLGFWSATPWLSDSQSKFQSYSTKLHSKDYQSDNKEFLENFPVSQENLHCLTNQYKKDPQFHIQFHLQFHIQCFNLLLDYLLLFGNFTPIPQIYTHRATNLAKNIFEEISPFSRKTYIVCKIWTKIVLLRF